MQMLPTLVPNCCIHCFHFIVHFSSGHCRPPACCMSRVDNSIYAVPSDPRARRLFNTLRDFAVNSHREELKLPASLSRRDRHYVQTLAQRMNLLVDDAGQRITLVKPNGSSIEPIEHELASTIREFVEDEYQTEIVFPKSLNKAQRQFVHELSESLLLEHICVGKGSRRSIIVRKMDKKTKFEKRRQMSHMKLALKQFQAGLEQQLVEVDELTLERKLARSKGDLRYANWNIQLMDALFESDIEFKESTAGYDVDLICRNIADVITELRVDILAIQEGPKNATRMQYFVDSCLGGAFTVYGGLEDNVAQQLYILVRRDCEVLGKVEYYHEMNEFLAKEWLFDVKGDFVIDTYHFTRRPLCLKAELLLPNGESRTLYAVAVHLKSKNITGGRRAWESNDEEKHEYVVKAVQNRRRIAGECMRLRKAINSHIYDKHEDPLLIVTGDMNDGAGMDYFEEYYLLSDCIHVLLGSAYYKKKILHALLAQPCWVDPGLQWTVVYNDYVDGNPHKRSLLDHIFVSEELESLVVRAEVEHLIYNDHVMDPHPTRRDQYPSDHRPVYVDIEFAGRESRSSQVTPAKRRLSL